MTINTTTPRYRRAHAAHVAYLIDSGMDLYAARTFTDSLLEAGLVIEGVVLDEVQDNRERLREEHGLADADLDGWQNRPQSGGSRVWQSRLLNVPKNEAHQIKEKAAQMWMLDDE
jgi:hypothetical protein